MCRAKLRLGIAHAQRKGQDAMGSNATGDEDAAADKDSNLLRRILSISREMKFPKDVVWPPAAEMDFDFAGKGYGRSPGTSHGILHELVDQKADGDSNGVFFNRRQTLKHLVQLLELSSGITRRAETQGLRFRSTRYLCISPQIHPQNVNVFSCCC